MTIDRPPIDTSTLMGIGNVRIVTATPDDLAWVDKLSRQHAHAIGHVPKIARRRRVQQRDYWRVTLDGDDAGFVLVGGGTRAPLRLSQVAISDELWRNGIGSACIDVLRGYGAAWYRRHASLVATIADRLPMLEVAAMTGGMQLASRLHISRRGRRVHYFAWPSLFDGSRADAIWFTRYLKLPVVAATTDFASNSLASGASS